MDPDSDTADPSMPSSSQSVSTNPKVFSYKKLNKLICDMNLSEGSSKLLAFKLKEKILLDCGTKVKVEAGNNSNKLKTETRQILCSLCRSKILTKTVYNKLIKSIRE